MLCDYFDTLIKAIRKQCFSSKSNEHLQVKTGRRLGFNIHQLCTYYSLWIFMYSWQNPWWKEMPGWPSNMLNIKDFLITVYLQKRKLYFFQRFNYTLPFECILT